MSKRSGSVSLMAVMIFSVLALLSLYLFSRIETQSLTTKAMGDSAQSGYYAESLTYLAWRNLNEEKLTSILVASTQELPRPSYGEVTAQSVELERIEEEGKYSTFTLSTRVKYKGISSMAQLNGELVDPVFFVENGHLDFRDDGFHKIVSPWIESLEKDLSYKIGRNDDMWSAQNGDYIEYSNRRYRLIREDKEIGSFTSSFPVRGSIRGTLLLKSPVALKGLVLVGEDAVIKGDLQIKGVCILKPGCRIEGRLLCDGIVLGDKPEGVSVAFNPRQVESILRKFPKFIKVHDLHMKKTYEQ